MLKKTLFCAWLLVLATALAVTQENGLSVDATTNWEKQLIHSIISLDTRQAGIELPSGRSAALQILQMESPTLLKDSFFSLQIDSLHQLGHYIEDGTVPLSELNTLVEESTCAPPWFSRELDRISMTRTVPLPGIAGLFIRHTAPQPVPVPLAEAPTKPFTGILVDARGRLPVHGEYTRESIRPALFPRIWDTGMDLVYEKNMVDPRTAQDYGLVRYTTTTDEQSYRNRIGNDPLRITARGVFGRYRTDPVISREDYLKIVSIPENRTLLAEGRIVILCDPEALENTRLGPVKDRNYYVVRRDIERKLAATPVQRMDFSDSWQGLKITMYDIRFVADTAQILESERGRIDIVADALLLAGENASFVVEGHTANVGKPAGELNLSIERARKIGEELTRRGIDPGRLRIAGYGGTRPVAPNTTDEGRALNRRVEITIDIENNRQD
ncbi:MAG TPA: OmpA family protein [Treponemataceae bacterium]|nr:OmpA family protein [Treponemataceae bacterium]